MRYLFNILFSFCLFGFNYKKKILNTHNIINNDNLVEEKIYNLKENIEKYLSEKKINNDLNYDLTLNQFIFKNLINNKFFNQKIILTYYFKSKFYFPLPSEIILIVKKNGLNVNYFASKILWIFFILLFFLYYLLTILANCIDRYKSDFKSDKEIFVYIDNIPNIKPNTNYNDGLPDLFQWFSEFFIKYKKIDQKIVFVHNNSKIKNVEINFKNKKYKVVYFKNYILRNLNIRKYLSSVKDAFLIINNIGFEKILLIDELIKYKYLSMHKENLPDYSLFNVGNMHLQPLWTKIKNQNNVSTNYLFYFSTNIIPIIENPLSSANIFGYRIQSWDNYIFWNENMKNWVERCSNKKLNSIVTNDYLPFEGENIRINRNHFKRVVIFDVPPKNDDIYYNLLHPYNIYNIDYCKNFFLETTQSIRKTYPDAEIYYKIKRNLQTINPEYKNLILNEEKKSSKFKIFYDNISAQSLIKCSDATISIPFTSTAIISSYLQKPTVYYNPNDKYKIKNHLSDDVDLIDNRNILISWLEKI